MGKPEMPVRAHIKCAPTPRVEGALHRMAAMPLCRRWYQVADVVWVEEDIAPPCAFYSWHYLDIIFFHFKRNL